MRTTLTTRRPAVLLVAGAVLAVTLTACGNGSTTPTAAASSSAAAGNSTGQGVAAAHNDADVTFINDMAPHHSGAIAMSELAAGQASSAQVKDLAGRIASAQGPEIEKMKAMAAAWKVALNTDATGMSGGMSGTGGDDVAALKPLTGAAFDKEFLTRMTAHHSSAVEMAKTEVAQGTNPQAKELAAAIIAAQEKEIAEMGTLLKTV